MTAIAILDTNAISDLMRDEPIVTARYVNYPGIVATSTVAIGEIRFGVNRLPTGRKKTHLEARAASIISPLQLETVTVDIAEEYGRIKSFTRSRGIVVGDNDLWIAATASSLGYLLATRDQGLSNIPGLNVEDWSA